MTDREETEVGAASWRKRVGRVLLVLGGLVASGMGLIVLLLGALQIDAVSGYVARRSAEWMSSDSLRLGVKSARGSWVRGLELAGLEVEATTAGKPVWTLSLDTVSVRYHLLPLLRREVDVSMARLTGLSAWIGPSSAEQPPREPEPASSWAVSISRLEVDANEIAWTVADTTVTEPWRVIEGMVMARDIVVGEEVSAVLDTLDAGFQPPGRPRAWGRVVASGSLEGDLARIRGLTLRSPESDVRAFGVVPLTLAGTAPEGLDLEVTLEPLLLGDIRPFVPEQVPDTLRVRGRVALRTDADTLRANLVAESEVPGRVEIDANLSGPRESPDMNAVVRAVAVDLEAWGFAARPLVMNATIEADLDSVRMVATHGRIDAELRVDEADGTRMAALDVEARAESSDAPWRARWTAGGLGLESSGTATIALAEGPDWSLEGALKYVRPPSRGVGENEGPVPSSLLVAAGHLRTQGVGFVLDSLTGNASLRLDSLLLDVEERPGSTTVVGPGTVDVDLRRGKATLGVDLAVGGGRLRFTGDGDLAERSGRVVDGRVEGVDVAALVGDTVRSRISARFSGELPSSSPLRGSTELRLEELAYGAWEADSARVSAGIRGDEVTLGLFVSLPDSGWVGAGMSGRIVDGALQSMDVDSLGWASLDVRRIAAASDSSMVPATMLSGSGRGGIARGANGWAGSLSLDVGPSVVGGTTVEEGRLAARLDSGLVALDLTLVADEARVDGEARISTTPARSFVVPALRFQDLDLGTLTSGTLPGTRLSGVVSGEGVVAGVETARGSLRFALSSSIYDSILVDTASVDLRLDSGEAHARVLVQAFAASLSVEGSGNLADPLPFYVISGSVDRTPAEGVTGPTGFARFGIEGRGLEPDDADAEVWIEIDSARVVGSAVEAGSLRGGVRGGTVRLDTLDFRLPGMDVAGAGTLPLRGGGGEAGAFRVTVKMDRSDVLSVLLPTHLIGVGEATAELRGRGSLEDLDIEGESHVSALLFDDVRVQGVELGGQGRRTTSDGWVTAGVRLHVDRLRLPAAPVQSLEIEANLETEDEVSLVASAIIDDRRDARLTARIEQVSTPSAIRLEELTFRADQDRWTLGHPARIEVEDGFRIDSLVIAADGQEIRLRGGVAPAGDIDLRARIEEFEISTVADLFGYPALAGRISGSMDLTGTAELPVLHARLESRLEPRDADPADVALSLDYEEGMADFTGSVDLAEGTLRADVTVPYDRNAGSQGNEPFGTGSVRGSVAAEAFPLSWFEAFVPRAVARNLEGRLDGAVELGGTLETPSVDGSLALAGGAVDLPGLGVRYTEAGGRFTFDDTRITIDSLHLRSGDGRLSTTGTLLLEPLDNPGYDLSVIAEDFEAIRSPAVHATVSGRMEVRGEGSSPRVSGEVEVERADLYLEELVADSNLDPVALTEEQWEELARVFGYQRPSERMQGSPLMESITLDLDVRLGRASWVRQRANPELALQFAGEMSVQKEPGDSLQLVGSVEAVAERSWVEQFGRRFSITQGRLTFRGPPAATLVEVQAEYEVPSRENPGEPEVILSLTVTGTPEDLSLELSSTPVLEASDMVSYLVTGRPASQSLESGGDASLTDTGGALALGRLSGAVEAYARDQVGLDVIEITTDGLDGVTLLAGRYLSPSLYLGVRQPISLQRSSEDPTQGAPDSEIEVELQAVRWLLLNLRAGGRRGIEFYVRSRIAYD